MKLLLPLDENGQPPQNVQDAIMDNLIEDICPLIKGIQTDDEGMMFFWVATETIEIDH